MLKNNHKIYAANIFLLLFLLMPSSAYSKNLAVAELFTSQSCSSCPAADKVLEFLSQDPDVITIGYHVTYWDHLSWRDTLSLPEATKLQKDFNGQRGSGRIYTPQMVINGDVEFVGSQKNTALQNVSRSKNIPEAKLEKVEDGIRITKPEGLIVNASTHSLMLIELGKDKTQAISSGENSGRTEHYVSPVKAISYFSPNQDFFSLQNIKEKSEQGARYVVLFREGLAGKIIAAGKI